MSARILIATALIVGALLAGPSTAWASDGEGNFATSAGASTAPGAVSVSAGESWTPLGGSMLAVEAQPHPSGQGGPANPNQPYGCTYTVEPASVQQLLGPGGSGSGQWVLPYCKGPGAIDPLPPVWAATGQPPPPAPAVNPAAVGQQAVSKLAMLSPAIEMAPPPGAMQLVRVATWLWINPGAWQALTASASAGPVTATATARPVKVVWTVGNGDTVTCDGPGTPYSPAAPNATTNCSYTWGQAGGYQVTATLYWSVTWTATGAPGGGNLGLQAGPAARVAVTVTESQAINTPTGGGN